MKRHLLGVVAAMALVIVWTSGPASAVARDGSASAPAVPPAAGPTRALEGILRVVAADRVEPGTSEHTHRVLVTGTRTYFLEGRNAERARANRRVRVVGTLAGSTVGTQTVSDLGAAPGGVSSTGTTRVLVMLAHWNAPDTMTPETAASQMFTDTNGWYRDASYGALGQTGDVTPWMEIAGPAGGACFQNGQSVMDQAKTAAMGLGYELAEYDNFVLYFPDNSWQAGSDCNDYSGWSYIGAQNTWLNGAMDRRVTVHEQGHNYGLWHSHSYMCSSGGLSGRCTWDEVGDRFDAMGDSGFVGHFSASQKDQLNWMTGRTVDLSAGGSATLAPLAADPASVSAAVVPVSSSRSYWLEYRQAADHDAGLPSYATDGVLVHVTDPSLGSTGDPGGNLLDVRPGDGIDASTATLRPGQSWSSPEGYRFTTNSVSATGAAVTVQKGTPVPCRDTALEPDDTATAARTATVPTTQQRAFCLFGDEDWVRFSATGGASYRLETLNLSGSTDTVLDLYGTDGTTLLTSNDDASTSTRASRIDFTPTTSGTYYVRATEFDGAFGEDRTYDLRIGGDAIPPTITTRSPGVNATNASLAGDITATFSEAVTGVSGTTFTLKNTATGAAVTAVVSRNGTTNQWLLNPSAFLASATRYTATLTGGATAIRDAAGNPLATSSWTFTTVQQPETAPVAYAGTDQTVANGAAFTLVGAGTSRNGAPLTYAWTQVSGPVAVIRDPDSPETVVEGIRGPTTLVFRLTVTDSSGASSSDEVTVTVSK